MEELIDKTNTRSKPTALAQLRLAKLEAIAQKFTAVVNMQKSKLQT